MNNPQFANFLVAAPDQYKVLGWIVLLPLLGAVLNGLIGRRVGREGVYILGVATVGASFLLSLFAFTALIRAGHATGVESGESGPTQITYLAWEWFHAPIAAGTVALKFRYALDSLSAVMLLVVTGVGTLIHLYSTGYMAHDEGYARFFAYMNLFMFSMLNLILADSVVLLFVGWEGVGLCSYLLIGFWYTNSQYASAGRKAFIVNRIGDVGVILGISILAWKAGAYEFSAMRESITPHGSTILAVLGEHADIDDVVSSWVSSGFGMFSENPWIHDKIYLLIPRMTWGGLACGLLFLGCAGKSAQIPLYVWLPDAMAGPTPVSALIHAATMVTAGVYLLCRMSFLYVHFPSVMAIVAIIGALTALLGASIALAQNDLKKVLAYSTVSQLGFMFIACGVGAFGAGLFHVYTHAMFKACLFLSAGAVMHACRDNQDIRELGGLRKYMPFTFWAFLLATAAIIGTPGFSGFFSKDEILFRALASHNIVHVHIPWDLLWRGYTAEHAEAAPNLAIVNIDAGKTAFAIGVVAATLTAFYMCRLLFLTFWGEFKGWSLVPGNAVVASVGAHAPASASTAGTKGGETPGEGDDEDDDEEDAEDGEEEDEEDDEEEDEDEAHGASEHDAHAAPNPWDPPRDNPWNITGVIVALAGMSVIAGWIGLPWLFTHHESAMGAFLEPSISEWHLDHEAAKGFEGIAMVFGVLAFAIGTAAAYFVYVVRGGEPARQLVANNAVRPLYRLVLDKWRVDEFYNATIVRPLRSVSNFAAGFFDVWVIDLVVKAVGWIPRLLGSLFRKIQTGDVHTYGTVMALGFLALLCGGIARPSATIGYRNQGSHLVLQAYGGLGYTYEWDLHGTGEFPDCYGSNAPTEVCSQNQETDCTPTDLPDGRRACVVGLRVHNAFGLTSVVTRTIEMPFFEAVERH